MSQTKVMLSQTTMAFSNQTFPTEKRAHPFHALFSTYLWHSNELKIKIKYDLLNKKRFTKIQNSHDQPRFFQKFNNHLPLL